MPGSAPFQGARCDSRIEVLLERILPALGGVDPGLPPEKQLAVGVEANVRLTVQRILESPEGRTRQAEDVMKLVGAVAELSAGVVRFLDA